MCEFFLKIYYTVFEWYPTCTFFGTPCTFYLRPIKNPNFLTNQWEIHPNKAYFSALWMYEVSCDFYSLWFQDHPNDFLYNMDTFWPVDIIFSITKINIPLEIAHLLALGHYWINGLWWIAAWWEGGNKNVTIYQQSITCIGSCLCKHWRL